MCHLISTSWEATVLLLIIIPTSLAGYRPGHPQLRHEEKLIMEERSFLSSLGSLFTKRDDCTTQYGPTYVDCGAHGCYQPSLGEICCADESEYCYAGEYCSGLNCCPDGLDYSCCDVGNNCPTNVSSYFTSSYGDYSTAPPAGSSTSLPVVISTSATVFTTSFEPSISSVSALTTSLTTTFPLSTLQSTSSVVAETVTSLTTSESVLVTTTKSHVTSSTNTGGGISTSVAASEAHKIRMRLGIEGAAVGVGVLGVVGFVAGLI